jgi:hypothetical protein
MPDRATAASSRSAKGVSIIKSVSCAFVFVFVRLFPHFDEM